MGLGTSADSMTDPPADDIATWLALAKLDSAWAIERESYLIAHGRGPRKWEPTPMAGWLTLAMGVVMLVATGWLATGKAPSWLAVALGIVFGFVGIWRGRRILLSAAAFAEARMRYLSQRAELLGREMAPKHP